VSRARLNTFIAPEHAKRLDRLAMHKGVSKSAVIAAALASFLSPDGGDQREAAIARRLDRLSRQFNRLERDQNILIETVALYVRYFLLPHGLDPGARTGRIASGGVRQEQAAQKVTVTTIVSA
jgi:predicted transcriptional regulator